jgi:hypothetical protein
MILPTDCNVRDGSVNHMAIFTKRMAGAMLGELGRPPQLKFIVCKYISSPVSF